MRRWSTDAYTLSILVNRRINSVFAVHLKYKCTCEAFTTLFQGAQWLSGRVLETEGPRVRASPASLLCGHRARHIYRSLVLVQPRKTRPWLTERLLMGRKESNQTNKQTNYPFSQILANTLIRLDGLDRLHG